MWSRKTRDCHGPQDHANGAPASIGHLVGKAVAWPGTRSEHPNSARTTGTRCNKCCSYGPIRTTTRYIKYTPVNRIPIEKKCVPAPRPAPSRLGCVSISLE